MRKHKGCSGTDDCFTCKIRTISFASSAMPTRSNASAQKKFEKDRSKNIDAYKRLRADGKEVIGTARAAALEAKANSDFELRSGQILPSAKIARQHDERQAEYNEIATNLRSKGVKV